MRGGTAVALVVPAAFVATLGIAVLGGGQEAQAGCAGGGARSVVTGPLPAVPGWNADQLQNAATIMVAAKDAGLPLAAQYIGVMASIGESTLVNVEYGDDAGPDSRGLFQQRIPWGSLAERMDPYTAATFFFTGGSAAPDGYVEPGLEDTAGWESMAPTLAINKVQINADPWHYEPYYDDAVRIVDALSGVTGGAELAVNAGAVPCGGDVGSVPVGPGGWTSPSEGVVTSGFGPRWGSMHNGTDFGAPLGAPTYAMADGVVVGVCKGNRSPCTGYGTLITIDHGGGIVSRYAHAENDGVLVVVGQQVKGGQQIARVGNYGNSTGPHLHAEIQKDGRFIDLVAFLRQRDVALAA